MAHLHATAFGPFSGVKVNPTERLVEALAGAIESDEVLKSLLVPRSSTVLTVAARDCAERIRKEIYSDVSGHASGASAPSPPALVVHFGVDVTRDDVHLESTGYNTANFRVPDEDGWQPRGEKIQADGPAQRVTTLPVGSVASQLGAAGLPVAPSTNPGRFVCNYIYYTSLGLAGPTAVAPEQSDEGEAEESNGSPATASLAGGEANGSLAASTSPSDARDVRALFVHVPNLSTIPAETQLECAVTALGLLCLNAFGAAVLASENERERARAHLLGRARVAGEAWKGREKAAEDSETKRQREEEQRVWGEGQ